MSGLGAGLVRALVGKTAKSVRAKRAYNRRCRRQRQLAQQAALWVAEHDLDAKPPTKLHTAFQEARRSDPAYFFDECLSQFTGIPPKKVVIPASFSRRACIWCGWPATAREAHCFRCGEEIDVLLDREIVWQVGST